jgi:hypothetical protein
MILKSEIDDIKLDNMKIEQDAVRHNKVSSFNLNQSGENIIKLIRCSDDHESDVEHDLVSFKSDEELSAYLSDYTDDEDLYC